MSEDGPDFSSLAERLLDPQLATPVFAAIYQRYCHQPRLEQVPR